MKPIEENIIQLLRSDRREAVSQIYDHYADTLYGVVFTMLSDEALAKEALQECLIKIWKNAGSYDAKKSRLFTWMLLIARNTALDRLRSERKSTDSRGIYEGSSSQATVNSDLIEIHRHIEQLDGKYAKVIFALFFQGLTQEETSEALQIPVSTVKSRLRTGLKELKSIYQDPLVLLLLMEFWI